MDASWEWRRNRLWVADECIPPRWQTLEEEHMHFPRVRALPYFAARPSAALTLRERPALRYSSDQLMYVR